MRLFQPSAGISMRSARSSRAGWNVARVANALIFCLGMTFGLTPSGSAQAAVRTTIQTLAPHALDGSTDLGPVASSQRISLTLTLAPTADRQAALDEFLRDLATPNSASYRKWITPAEFGATYGATADQIAAVIAWAEVQGLSVDAVSPAKTRMTISGFPAQIQGALAVTIHTFRVSGHSYYSNSADPSLTPDVAGIVTSIDGLSDLPAASVATVAKQVEGNSTPVLTFAKGGFTGDFASSTIAAYRSLFEEAAAQGITVLAEEGSGVPFDLAQVTAVAKSTSPAMGASSGESRPNWQVAPGLPEDGVRYAPDVTASSTSAFASTLASIAATVAGGRLGNINPVIYELAPESGIFSQPDGAAAGTWEPATGLGVINLEAFGKAFPRGAGSSYASFSASNYSPTHGQSITLTSSVTSGTGGATPTGTVSFITSMGATLGTAPVNSGTATFTTNTLAGGSYTVTANYSGDGTYAPAVSPSGTIFIQPEPSQLAVSVSTGNVIGGTYNVTVTDSSGSGVGTPGGNITLMLSGTGTTYTQALAPKGTNSASTTFTLPATTVGTLTLSINCSGDLSFSCYSAVTSTVVVAKATPVLNFSFSPNPVTAGVTVTLNATLGAVGTAPVPTGSVTFYDGATILNAGTLVNGSTSVTGSVPNTSTHSLSATYNGDANYNIVSSTGSSTTPVNAVLAAAISSNAGAPGATVTVTGTVTFPGAVQTGTILASTNFPTGGTSNFAGTLTATGASTASFSIAVSVPSTVGSYTVSVGCASTDSFTCNSVTFPLTSTSASGTTSTSTIITSSSYALTYGQGFTLTAGVTPSTVVKGTAPTGTVTFSGANGTISSTVPLVAGLANLAVPTLLSPGSYTFTATYSGDANYAPSTSAASTPVVVSAATATLAATINSPTVSTGSFATVTAVVTLPRALGAPGGTVTVTVPGVLGAVYSATLVASGANTSSVNIQVPAPPAGTYVLQVTCGTNLDFTCNTATVNLTSSATAAGKLATTTVLTITPASPAAGVATVLTATVTSATLGPAPISGTVGFYDGNNLIATAPVNSGVATASATFTGTATHTLTALYSGDANYSESTSAPLVLNAALLPVSVTISSSPSSGVAGSNLTLTAQVSGLPSPINPTGKVMFYLAGTSPALLGTATLSPTGAGLATAILNTGSIPAGSQSVYAVYAGDNVFSPGTSTTISIGLTDYSVTFTPSTISLTQGQTGNVTMEINPTGGFGGTITFACAAPINVEIACSVTPSILVGSGGATLTITTVAPRLKASNDHMDLKVAGGITFAALFCFLLPGGKRRRLPGMLLVMLAVGLTANLGCGSTAGTSTLPTAGTPLGTLTFTIKTAGNNASGSVSHDYAYQVTVQ